MKIPRSSGRHAAGMLVAAAVCGGGLLWISGASASGSTQISGTGVYDEAGDCGEPPAGYEEYNLYTLQLAGDLVGCLYTNIVDSKVTNGNTYRESGLELIVACLDTNGDGSCASEPAGTFETSYHFQSKWAGEPFADGVAQLNGRCEHPITTGSGTGAFAGVTGRLDFKDDVLEGDYDWRGHIAL